MIPTCLTHSLIHKRRLLNQRLHDACQSNQQPELGNGALFPCTAHMLGLCVLKMMSATNKVPEAAFIDTHPPTSCRSHTRIPLLRISDNESQKAPVFSGTQDLQASHCRREPYSCCLSANLEHRNLWEVIVCGGKPNSPGMFAPPGFIHPPPGSPLSSSLKIVTADLKIALRSFTSHFLPPPLPVPPSLLPTPGPNISGSSRKPSLLGHLGTGSFPWNLQLIGPQCKRDPHFVLGGLQYPPGIAVH